MDVAVFEFDPDAVPVPVPEVVAPDPEPDPLLEDVSVPWQVPEAEPDFFSSSNFYVSTSFA